MFALYSQRIKNQQGDPEVFIYDEFPVGYRNQFIYCIEDFFESVENKIGEIDWDIIAETISKIYEREKGLRDKIYVGWDSLIHYIQKCDDKDFLDMMDLIMHLYLNNKSKIVIHFSGYTINGSDYEKNIEKVISDINYRMTQHSLGYEAIDGKIIAKTNTITHEKIIKPTLKLLLDEDFRGAEEEYLLAFENLKNNDNENAIINANKAFESVMKTICGKLGYSYDPTKDTSNKLLVILKTNNFFPTYLNNHLSAVINSLETGAPTVRNKIAGHGQGENVREVGNEYVEYVLNLVSSNILFLYKTYRERKQNEQ